MNKQEFVQKLYKKLSLLPSAEAEERISFYMEIIDDKIEEGFSEQEAVLSVGSVDDIFANVLSDIPLGKIVKEKMKCKRRLSGFEVILLILGSPIWLSLLISAVAVVISLYVSLWSVVISLYSIFVSVIAITLYSLIFGIVQLCALNTVTGFAMIGAGIFCAGLSIFFFFTCKASTRGMAALTKKCALCIKKCFLKGESKNV